LRGHYSLLAEHDLLGISFDEPRPQLEDLLHRLGVAETEVAWLLSPHDSTGAARVWARLRTVRENSCGRRPIWE
jgi:hypothetical protein